MSTIGPLESCSRSVQRPTGDFGLQLGLGGSSSPETPPRDVCCTGSWTFHGTDDPRWLLLHICVPSSRFTFAHKGSARTTPDQSDQETGERYTVKRYQSEKVESVDHAWRHLKITLKPINPDYKPIELTCDEEGQVQVVAEFIETLS